MATTNANRVAIALALLDAGAGPNAKYDLQDSAYLYAGAEGLNNILAHGADVTSTNRYGGTALIPASGARPRRDYPHPDRRGGTGEPP